MNTLKRILSQSTVVALLMLGVAVPMANAAANQLVHPQVIGGGEAPTSTYPFVARLETSVDSDGYSVPPNSLDVVWSGYCTASLIAPQWVVTAAHCAQPSMFDNTQNRWQVNFLNAVGHPIARVDHAYIHPGYSNWISSQYASQDIALMHLSSPMALDLIGIAQSRLQDQANRDNATLAGYGVTDEANQEMSKVLNSATLGLGSDAYCDAQPGAGSDRVNSSFQLCRSRTSTITGSQGISCNGDSGGPVMLPNQTSGAPILVGIVSWGAASSKGCWAPGAYDVYTRVGALADWISRITKQNFTNNPAFNMSTHVSSAAVKSARPLSSSRLKLRLALGGGSASVRVWSVRYVSSHYVNLKNTKPITLRMSNTRGRSFTIPVSSVKWRSKQCINFVVQSVNKLGNYSKRRVFSFRTYSKRHHIYLKAGSCPGASLMSR